MTPTIVDKLIYEAANSVPGQWAVDVDRETGEPLRVRYDGPGGAAVGTALFIRIPPESIIGYGRRYKSAEKALKRAHEAYAKHQKDRERWGMAE